MKKLLIFAWALVAVANGQIIDTGGSGTVDNAAVVSAIEENPLSARFALNNPKRIGVASTAVPMQDSSSNTSAITAVMARWPYESPAFKIRSLSLHFANWRNLGETFQLIAGVRFRASIEYPSGKFYPVLFNGDRNAYLENRGEITSDPVELIIPENTQYWVRLYYETPNGNLSQVKANTSYGGSTAGVHQGNPGYAASIPDASTHIGLSGGGISFVYCTHGGSGYPPNTRITCDITGGGGTGAEVEAEVDEAGIVKPTLKVIAAGTGYTTRPTITVPGNATGTSIYGGVPYDLTMSGTVTTAAAIVGGFGPTAIAALPYDRSSKRSYIAIGDSITAGFYDTTPTRRGWAPRIFDSYGVPIIQAGHGGAQLYGAWGASGIWLESEIGIAEKFATDAIIMMGTNDVADGQSLVQMQTNLAALVARLTARGIRCSVCTIPPRTDVNDIPLDGGREAVRVAYNDWLRTVPLGFEQCFEVADTLETARNSGVWKPLLFYPSDSGNNKVHPSTAGFDAMNAAFSTIIP